MKPEYCADVIAIYQNQLVLIERYTFPQGIALPGGRRDLINEKGTLESPLEAALREFKEETGLEFHLGGELGTYDEPNRDPRGPKTSTVLYGTATGTIQNEKGKTKVFLHEPTKIDELEQQFVFDHYQILQDYFKKNS